MQKGLMICGDKNTDKSQVIKLCDKGKSCKLQAISCKLKGKSLKPKAESEYSCKLHAASFKRIRKC